MKRIIMGLLSGILFLSACGQTQSATQSIPTPIVEQATGTPSSIPTSTQTFLPSSTPTASITPLPTIPTFTPTFDVSTIVTVTPAPKAECPEENSLNEIINELRSSRNVPLKITSVDITNDGIPDTIVGVYAVNLWLVISAIFCENGEYQRLSLVGSDMSGPTIARLGDLNKNGIPEIVTIHNECMGMGRCNFVEVLEWNSIQFIPLHPDEYGLGGSWNNLEIEFKDVDKNGTVEILLTEPEDTFHDIWLQGHRRSYTKTYMWNGTVYSLFSLEEARPDHLFEAIQDGDYYSSQFQFERAHALYLTTINKKLLPWSKEIQFNFVQNVLAPENEPTLTPPPPDVTEYPRLAAYAYYRIMLLHFVQNHESDAGTVYNTLQENFGTDPHGRPYVEMASAFWEVYQSTHKMYDGCAAAIQYAAEHPEILIPLGSDYHGAQSHTYVPADVCPFR